MLPSLLLGNFPLHDVININCHAFEFFFCENIDVPILNQQCSQIRIPCIYDILIVKDMIHAQIKKGKHLIYFGKNIYNNTIRTKVFLECKIDNT